MSLSLVSSLLFSSLFYSQGTINLRGSMKELLLEQQLETLNRFRSGTLRRCHHRMTDRQIDDIKKKKQKEKISNSNSSTSVMLQASHSPFYFILVFYCLYYYLSNSKNDHIVKVTDEHIIRIINIYIFLLQKTKL
jgi:hypothetical protein